MSRRCTPLPKAAQPMRGNATTVRMNTWHAMRMGMPHSTCTVSRTFRRATCNACALLHDEVSRSQLRSASTDLVDSFAPSSLPLVMAKCLWLGPHHRDQQHRRRLVLESYPGETARTHLLCLWPAACCAGVGGGACAAAGIHPAPEQHPLRAQHEVDVSSDDMAMAHGEVRRLARRLQAWTPARAVAP
jgi:hypothetical protein